MIREGGSASRVSINARPRDPGGGTVSTDPRRWIVLHDVIVYFEQLRVKPTLVSPTSTVQTGQALAEDTHNQECSHDVVRLYAHRGTMWNTDDCVPAGGHPPAMFPVASALPIEEPQLDSWQVIVVWVDETFAGDFSEQESPCDSQNRRRPMDMNNSLNSLVPTVVQGGPVGPQRKEPLALLVLNHADPVGRHAVVQKKLLGPAGPKVIEPLALLVLMNNSLTSLVHTVVRGGPAGPQRKEPLALLVLNHADPVGRYALVQKKLLGPAGPKVKEPLALLVLIDADPAGQRDAIYYTTSLWEGSLAQPEPPDGDRLVEVISDKESTVCQVPGSALDSQLMEGITYTEVFLHSRPMEGSSSQEPVEQSILLSSCTDNCVIEQKPCNCVIEQKPEWEPVITPAINHNLDSQPLEGITYLEHPAPAVYLDSWPMEGEVGSKKSECAPLITPAISYNLDSRPMEGITYLEHLAPVVYLDSWPMEGEVESKKFEWEPVITPADSYDLDRQPMEGATCLEHPAWAVYLDSWPRKGASYPRPHIDWEVLNSRSTLNQVANVKFVDTDANDDVNTYLPECLTLMSTPMTALAWPCVYSSRLPTVKPEIINRMKDSGEVNMTLPESEPPMIDSNVSMENWEDGVCRPLIYAGDFPQEVLKTDSRNPEAENIQHEADKIYTGQMATRTRQWLYMGNNLDTDSVAELEYKTWVMQGHGNSATHEEMPMWTYPKLL